MKTLILFLFVAVVAMGCRKEDCCNDPATINDEWLKKTIADLEKSDLNQYFYIQRAQYKGECVVYVNNCCPMCNTVILLYRCDGTKIENPDLTKLTDQQIVWKPDAFSCEVQ